MFADLYFLLTLNINFHLMTQLKRYDMIYSLVCSRLTLCCLSHTHKQTNILHSLLFVGSAERSASGGTSEGGSGGTGIDGTNVREEVMH